jgi:hypothetical protein
MTTRGPALTASGQQIVAECWPEAVSAAQIVRQSRLRWEDRVAAGLYGLVLAATTWTPDDGPFGPYARRRAVCHVTRSDGFGHCQPYALAGFGLFVHLCCGRDTTCINAGTARIFYDPDGRPRSSSIPTGWPSWRRRIPGVGGRRRKELKALEADETEDRR